MYMTSQRNQYCDNNINNKKNGEKESRMEIGKFIIKIHFFYKESFFIIRRLKNVNGIDI